jgi:hypothetical protein
MTRRRLLRWSLLLALAAFAVWLADPSPRVRSQGLATLG